MMSYTRFITLSQASRQGAGTSPTAAGRHESQRSLVGHWSNNGAALKRLKLSAGSIPITMTQIASGRARAIAKKGPPFFTSALNLCLIHGLGTRQNGSLFESVHGAAAGPDECSQRAHMQRICRGNERSRHSGCWRAQTCSAPPRATPLVAKKQIVAIQETEGSAIS